VPPTSDLTVHSARNVVRDHLRKESGYEVIVVAADHERRAGNVLEPGCEQRLILLPRQFSPPPKNGIEERGVKLGRVVANVRLICPHHLQACVVFHELSRHGGHGHEIRNLLSHPELGDEFLAETEIHLQSAVELGKAADRDKRAGQTSVFFGKHHRCRRAQGGAEDIYLLKTQTASEGSEIVGPQLGRVCHVFGRILQRLTNSARIQQHCLCAFAQQRLAQTIIRVIEAKPGKEHERASLALDAVPDLSPIDGSARHRMLPLAVGKTPVRHVNRHAGSPAPGPNA
jgi:hypothetical protein